jgi:hypothetical protein
MAVKKKKKDSRLKRAGVSGYNKPKRTPGHAKKSHIVVAKSAGKARHGKNIAKGKMSAAYWANKVKW